jgi:thioredoxin reductase (NADPH)
MNTVVKKLQGDEALTSLVLENSQTNRETVCAATALFVSVGKVPDNQRFASLVKLDDGGYILAGEDCRTSADGIFVAGDCRTKVVRQLVTAAADGATAALGACRYVDRQN